MARRSRFVSPEVAEVLHRQEGRPPSPWARYSAPFVEEIPVAGVPHEFAHGLGEVPDGYLVLFTVGGTVQATNPVTWTDQVASLIASDANTTVKVIWITTREEPRNG